MEAEDFSKPVLQFSAEEVKFAVVQPTGILTVEDGGSDEACLKAQAQKRRPRPRAGRKLSEKKLCLFCMYEASPPEDCIFPQDMLGAVNCLSLQKDLQSFFILRQLLDIPSSWILSQVREKGKRLQEWFSVCSACFNVICQAWDLYQSLLSVSSQLKEVKDNLKGKIKESTKRYRSRIDSEHVKEIRKYSRSNRAQNSKPGEDVFFGVTEEDPIRNEIKRRHLRDPLSDEPEPIQVPNEDDPSSESRLRKLEHQGDMDCSPLGFSDEGDEDFIPDGAPLSDTDSFLDKSKSTKRRKKKGGNATPKKKRIVEQTLEEKRKRVWKKKPPKWPYRCELCPARYKVESEFTSHKEAHERNKHSNRPFDCNFCQYPCADLDELETHKYEKHLKSTNSRLMNYKCKKCPFTIQYYYLLEEHVRNQHADVPEEDCGLVPLVCKICNQKAATINSAILHKKLMHPEVSGAFLDASIFQCDECGEKFDNKIRLKYHQNAHIRRKKEEARYTCEVCGKGFKWQSRLRHHYSVHSVERQWICSLCGLDFTFKNGLVRHNKRYHPQSDTDQNNTRCNSEVPPNFQCGVCGLEMPPGHRKRHLKMHQESYEYKCNLCDRSYLKKQALKRHKIINHSNGENTAKCEYCNKAFIHADYVKCHYKFCRVKNMPASSLGVGTEVTVDTSAGSHPPTSSTLSSSLVPVPVPTSNVLFAGEARKIDVELVEVASENEIILPIVFRTI